MDWLKADIWPLTDWYNITLHHHALFYVELHRDLVVILCFAKHCCALETHWWCNVSAVWSIMALSSLLKWCKDLCTLLCCYWVLMLSMSQILSLTPCLLPSSQSAIACPIRLWKQIAAWCAAFWPPMDSTRCVHQISRILRATEFGHVLQRLKFWDFFPSQDIAHTPRPAVLLTFSQSIREYCMILPSCRGALCSLIGNLVKGP